MKGSEMYRFILLTLFVILSAASLQAQDLYQTDVIQTIKLTFSRADWDYALDSLYSKNPDGRLIASVEINGLTFDSVGVRYKGNSTYKASQKKNPLNIKLDYIREDQTYQGYGTLRLANIAMDPSSIREVLGYEIVRKYMPASKANFANVYINGLLNGLYTNVQDPDSKFTKTWFGDPDNIRFKGDLVNDSPSAQVKVWGYLGSDSSVFYPYYELETATGWKELVNFLTVFNNQPASMESVLNVDRHLWMLALDILMVNLDAPVNFGHNYYLFVDDAGRFNPVIWDLNMTFGGFSQNLGASGSSSRLTLTGMQQLSPYFNETHANYPIISKVLAIPLFKKILIAHMKTILKNEFSSGVYKTRAEELQTLIDASVQADPNKFYTYSQFKSGLTSSVTGGSGPPGSSVVGVTQLMDGRATWLAAHSAFTAVQPEIGTVSLSQERPVPGSEVFLTVPVSSATSVSFAWRTAPWQPFSKTALTDSGENGDAVAGDGIWTVTFTATEGTTDFYLIAENQSAAAVYPEKAEFEFLSFQSGNSLVINELVSNPDSTFFDQDGEAEDWIEVYNGGPDAVNLGGWFLSDETKNPAKWTFPDTVLAPGGFLIVWADEDGKQTGLHASFKLSASGEKVYLSGPDTVQADYTLFGALTEGTSWGRKTDGTGNFEIQKPTPGKINSGSPVSAESDREQLPAEPVLFPNYPNPFNPATTLSFYLPDRMSVSVDVWTVTGQKVASLVSGVLPAGKQSVIWNAAGLASGLYFCTLTAGTTHKTLKMVLLK